jgi:hypothetical protein
VLEQRDAAKAKMLELCATEQNRMTLYAHVAALEEHVRDLRATTQNQVQQQMAVCATVFVYAATMALGAWAHLRQVQMANQKAV